MLGHQLPALPPQADFWDALPEVFTWFTGAAEAPERAHIEHADGEAAIRSRVLPMGIPRHARAPIEIIRFAAPTVYASISATTAACVASSPTR